MIEFVTVWFLVACTQCNSVYSDSYAIPYATQNICLKQASKFEEKSPSNKAYCVFGQLPVYKQVR